MKTWIHPVIHDTEATCTCWAKFVLRTTMEKMKVETCSKCHSFYTWVKREDNKASRVAKFRERQAAAQSKTEEKEAE